METNLLDRMLDTYLEGRIPVTMTLQNKIRVSGTIRAFDSYVIVMEGQKREIVYRHAVSYIAPNSAPEQKRPPRAAQPAVVSKNPPSRPAKSSQRKQKPAQPRGLVASGEDQGISNSMKEGLLRWMQKQKAAK